MQDLEKSVQKKINQNVQYEWNERKKRKSGEWIWCGETNRKCIYIQYKCHVNHYLPLIFILFEMNVFVVLSPSAFLSI